MTISQFAPRRTTVGGALEQEIRQASGQRPRGTECAPAGYREEMDTALEAARYLKSKNPESDVAVGNYATGEVLSITVHDPLARANGKTKRATPLKIARQRRAPHSPE
jgi:hypothetical protein